MKVYGTRNYGIKTRVQLSLSKKDMEIRIKLDMGHNTNKISYNFKIKEMRASYN